MSVFAEIRELKSRNDFEGAWQVGWEALAQELDNEFLKTSLFWIIYAQLKSILEPIKARENKAPHPHEQEVIDLWASRITALQFLLPNENIDFRLWNLFGEVGRFCDPLCLFVLQSGSNIFSAGDHKPFFSPKGEAFSTVVKVARMVASGYLLKGKSSPLPASRVVALIKYAVDKAGDSEERKLWLEYDKARIYIAAGELTRARESYLAVLRKKRRESWAWFGLAKTYADEPEKAICLIASGLTFAHDPKFSIPGLVDLAERLAERMEYEYASKALAKLMAIYSQNNWTPKDNIVKLTAYSWYDAAVDVSDFDTVVQGLAEDAGKYTIAKPVYYRGVLQSVHASNKGANIYISRDLVFSARKAVFERRDIPRPGTFLRILCDVGGEQPDVISVAIAPAFEDEDIRSFSGLLKVTEKGFGFVDSEVFVPAGLVSGVQTDVQVAGLAVMSFDKIKNKYSWKAVTLSNEAGMLDEQREHSAHPK